MCFWKKLEVTFVFGSHVLDYKEPHVDLMEKIRNQSGIFGFRYMQFLRQFWVFFWVDRKCMPFPGTIENGNLIFKGADYNKDCTLGLYVSSLGYFSYSCRLVGL